MTRLTKDGCVEFRFYRKGVSEVAVTGDFNGWSRHDLLMHDEGDGWWVAELKLRGGDYRFRYLADGSLYTDYASNGVEATQSGYDSLLVVPRARGECRDRQRQVA